MGRIENLTVDGFLLRSDAPVSINQEFKISLSLPSQVNQKSVIRFLATSLWGEEIGNTWQTRTSDPEYYWTGLEITALNQGDRKTIEQLICMLDYSAIGLV